MPKLGVNIDHLATLRQARKEGIPDLAAAVLEAEAGGADGITMHLREDRRHIQDRDLPLVRKACDLPINMEMALHPEIISIALKFRPEKVCMVPEKRQELTTEGGLNVIRKTSLLQRTIPKFHQKKIQVSLFIDPAPDQIKRAAELGADAIEIHTGTYANTKGQSQKRELQRIQHSTKMAKQWGLKVHAGHGLNYQNGEAIARIQEIEELNIGFSIIARSVFVGLKRAVLEMKELIN